MTRQWASRLRSCWHPGHERLQIAAALAERGERIAVAHTAEILDASIRGRPLVD